MSEKIALIEFMGGACCRCREVPQVRHDRPWNPPIYWDHIVPVSAEHLRPDDAIGNLQPLCKPCHIAKGVEGSMEDWRPEGWRDFVARRAPEVRAFRARRGLDRAAKRRRALR